MKLIRTNKRKTLICMISKLTELLQLSILLFSVRVVILIWVLLVQVTVVVKELEVVEVVVSSIE